MITNLPKSYFYATTTCSSRSLTRLTVRVLLVHSLGLQIGYRVRLIGCFTGRFPEYPSKCGIFGSFFFCPYLSLFEYLGQIRWSLVSSPPINRLGTLKESLCLDDWSTTMAQQLVYYMLAVIFGMVFGIPIIR